jgi:hypothetical protein
VTIAKLTRPPVVTTATTPGKMHGVQDAITLTLFLTRELIATSLGAIVSGDVPWSRGVGNLVSAPIG